MTDKMVTSPLRRMDLSPVVLRGTTVPLAIEKDRKVGDHAVLIGATEAATEPGKLYRSV